MKFALGMMVAAVSADTAFLQMKATTKRVSTKNDDDFVYGEDGVADDVMDHSATLGVHEFMEAQADDEVDAESTEDPETQLSAADDEVTNFGEDGQGEQMLQADESEDAEDDAEDAE